MINFGQCEVGKETEKALEINLETGNGKDRWVWFPKSVVQFNAEKELLVKSWFCRTNRIYPVAQRGY